MDLIKPHDAIRGMVAAGVAKAALPVHDLLLRGFLGGALMAFATNLAFTVISQTHVPLLGAIVFPVGCVMSVLLGLELVTGSFAVTTLAAVAKRCSWGRVLRNLALVFGANLFGAATYGALLSLALGGARGATSDVAALLVRAAETKTLVYAAEGVSGFATAFTRAVLCNWIVCLGIVMAYASPTLATKAAAMWLPIMTFFAQGFEHAVVNFFIVPTGMLFGANVSLLDWWLWNQAPVTLGNAVGGFVFTALFLYWTYRAPQPAPTATLPAQPAPASA